MEINVIKNWGYRWELKIWFEQEAISELSSIYIIYIYIFTQVFEKKAWIVHFFPVAPFCLLGPLLLTWIKFNPSMDK